jgi:hypothetical protein
VLKGALVQLTRHTTPLGAARIALVAGATLAVLITNPASAHEERPVGPVQLTVGWVSEPTFTGFPNGVQLFLNDSAGAPITDLGDSLKVEVSLGEEKTGPLALEPAFGEDFGTPGEYNAHLIPTRPGAYSFHFTGSVRGQNIDETFSGSEEHGEGFSIVEDPKEEAFPAKDPSTAELSQKLDRLEPRLEQAQQQLAASTNDADDAKSSASTATILGVVAMVVAVALGGGAFLAGRRRT